MYNFALRSLALSMIGKKEGLMNRTRRLVSVALLTMVFPLLAVVRAQTLKPLRIVLMVDSSTNVGSMLNSFRAGLNAFIDTLPEDAEVAFITSGGQLGIKVPVTTDRQKLHDAANRFASNGGANVFVETLLEADKRFLKPAKDRVPVFVILTTDNGETVAETRIDEYNKFVNDFRLRGGVAHVIIVKGRNTGAATDVAINLTQNTAGLYKPIAVANAVPDLMKSVGRTLIEERAARQP
jgi:hypothetical protein